MASEHEIFTFRIEFPTLYSILLPLIRWLISTNIFWDSLYIDKCTFSKSIARCVFVLLISVVFHTQCLIYKQIMLYSQRCLLHLQTILFILTSCIRFSGVVNKLTVIFRGFFCYLLKFLDGFDDSKPKSKLKFSICGFS